MCLFNFTQRAPEKKQYLVNWCVAVVQDHSRSSKLVLVDLFNSADEDFFHRINTNPNHVLQPYLPDKINLLYQLRNRTHNMTLINKTKFLNDSDFIVRMLYKHSYWSAQTGHETVSYVVGCTHSIHCPRRFYVYATSVLSRHIFGEGEISPQTSNSPPRTWGVVCYYMNVIIPISLLSAQK